MFLASKYSRLQNGHNPVQDKVDTEDGKLKEWMNEKHLKFLFVNPFTKFPLMVKKCHSLPIEIHFTVATFLYHGPASSIFHVAVHKKRLESCIWFDPVEPALRSEPVKQLRAVWRKKTPPKYITPLYNYSSLILHYTPSRAISQDGWKGTVVCHKFIAIILQSARKMLEHYHELK